MDRRSWRYQTSYDVNKLF